MRFRSVSYTHLDVYKRQTKNDGHITKYAAEALLARAYLFYTGYYGEEPVEVTRAEDVYKRQSYVWPKRRLRSPTG